MEQPVHGISLANLHLVEALVHNRARLAGNRSRTVCAVIRDDKHIQQSGRIILRFQVAYQLPDDALLVARRDHCRIAMQLCVLFALFPFSQQTDSQINDLIGIGCCKEYEQHELQAI